MSPDAPPGSFGWELARAHRRPLSDTIGILSHNYWSQTVSLEQAGWYRFRALGEDRESGRSGGPGVGYARVGNRH